MKSRLRISGFSLVEIVLVIGIASFALLAVVGLLPVGMQSSQNAREQAAAANVMNSIANALRNAEKNVNSDGTLKFSNSLAGQTFEYKIGDTQVTVAWDTLDLNGQSTTSNSTPARFKARLVITPPATSTSTGKAVISIAWPAQAPNISWNGSAWTNAQGQITTAIQFIPRQ